MYFNVFGKEYINDIKKLDVDIYWRTQLRNTSKYTYH